MTSSGSSPPWAPPSPPPPSMRRACCQFSSSPAGGHRSYTATATPASSNSEARAAPSCLFDSAALHSNERPCRRIERRRHISTRPHQPPSSPCQPRSRSRRGLKPRPGRRSPCGTAPPERQQASVVPMHRAQLLFPDGGRRQVGNSARGGAQEQRANHGSAAAAPLGCRSPRRRPPPQRRDQELKVQLHLVILRARAAVSGSPGMNGCVGKLDAPRLATSSRFSSSAIASWCSCASTGSSGPGANAVLAELAGMMPMPYRVLPCMKWTALLPPATQPQRGLGHRGASVRSHR